MTNPQMPKHYGSTIVGDWLCSSTDCNKTLFPRLAQEKQLPLHKNWKVGDYYILECPDCGSPMVYDEAA